MRLVGKIQEVEIKIPNDRIKEFLSKLMKLGYGLMWIPEGENMYLLVDVGEGAYYLPFFREEGRIKLNVEHIDIYHKGLINVLEEDVQDFEADGVVCIYERDRIYESRYKKGSLFQFKEMDLRGNVIECVEVNDEKEVEELIRKLEIDYYLKELYRYMKIEDKEGIERIKGILKELTNTESDKPCD